MISESVQITEVVTSVLKHAGRLWWSLFGKDIG